MYLRKLCCVLNCFNSFVTKVRYSRVIANSAVASRLLHRQKWLSLRFRQWGLRLNGCGSEEAGTAGIDSVKRARSALTLAQISRDRNDDQGKTDQEAKINKNDMTIFN